MAIIQGGTAPNTPQDVDVGFNAARVAQFPMKSLGWNSITVPTGNITALAASAPIFSFRNISANPVLVRHVGAGFVCTTAFTTAQLMAFGLMMARVFTASDTGGTAIAFTGSNGKHRTSLNTPTSLDARVSTTAALGAGTRVLDANFMKMQSNFVSGVGTGIAMAPDNLLKTLTGNYPIVLAQNEGLIIANVILMGAAGVGVGYAGIEFAEVLPTGF